MVRLQLWGLPCWRITGLSQTRTGIMSSTRLRSNGRRRCGDSSCAKIKIRISCRASDSTPGPLSRFRPVPRRELIRRSLSVHSYVPKERWVRRRRSRCSWWTRQLQVREQSHCLQTLLPRRAFFCRSSEFDEKERKTVHIR